MTSETVAKRLATFEGLGDVRQDRLKLWHRRVDGKNFFTFSLQRCGISLDPLASQYSKRLRTANFGKESQFQKSRAQREYF